MIVSCQRFAASRVGFSRRRAASSMILRIFAKFARDRGLFSSQLGTQELSNLVLDRAYCLHLSIYDLSFEDLAVQRVAA